ncbi:MAG: DUF5060 domain-containing protein [Bryobacteraceae bacterium]
MRVSNVCALLLAAARLAAEDCSKPVVTYTPCELTFELTDAEAAAHPNPYLTVQMHAEFRSPRHRTILMPAFWDGGRRMVIRVSATDPGQYDYRITSNLTSVQGKEGSFMAADSDHPGFLQKDNVHHWSHTEKRKPHLWMGDTSYRFAWIDRATFDQILDARASQNFNHIRGLVMSDDEKLRKAYISPDQPNPEHFRELDSRILAMNRKGIFADLILGSDQNHLVKVFPTWQQRERYIRYLVARYSPMMITWQGVQEFEEYADGRGLLKEIGNLLIKLDAYKHPRSTHTLATSAPLLDDGWMTHIVYQSSAISLGSIERQLYRLPMVNAEFGYEDSGAGKSHPHHVDSDTFRKRLWNMTMNGQYPTFGNTGTYGGRKFEVDAKYAQSPGAKAMKAWWEFFSETRFWELEPFYEVDGGRALALAGIEYIVYLEKPGTVEIVTERKGYEVYWFRPSDGEIIHEKKGFKGERFSGAPPDNKSDWVLHLSRDGRKEGMLKSWKFESRPVYQQDVERIPAKIPFEMVAPGDEELVAGKPVKFRARLTRETRASRAMVYMWTAEATSGGGGYRIVATAPEGELTIPKTIARAWPAVVNLRLYGMNANGKVYSLDRVLRVRAE